MRSRAASAAARAVTFAIALAVALLAAEGLVRIAAPQSLWFPWAEESSGLLMPRPSVSGRHSVPGCFDVRESIGPQRFRGPRSYAEKAAPGVVRIAVLGDSSTYGVGAGDGETYPAQMEEALRRAGLKAEVINAGVPGTGTGEQALYWQRWVARFNPQVVVLTVTPNDPADDAARRLFRYDGKSAQPAASSTPSARNRLRQLVNVLPGYRWLAQHSHLLGLVRAVASRPSREPVSSEQPLTDDMLALTRAEVLNLRDSVTRTGGRLVVVFLPGEERIYQPDGAPGQEERRIARALRDTLPEDIGFVDATPGLLALALSRPEQRIYYPPPDGHPRPETYQAVAALVAARLRCELQAGGATAACWPRSAPER